ncbi:MAG: nucleoside phosphorylase [Desulfobulbus sp.]|jgi:uridine phosphorylase|uniref:nucleoside phosphorylase n=1 Tax=Desulfobulbus sp. TaxID=895 RepID=UPI00284D2953|nr:nucleoside phosphorylase [Desulfobulbus sp.]MDR2551500.1 nucleoside phosphorylase [Desulfobulbus sp.]
MSDCIVNPTRSPKDPQLPPIGILAVNPADSACFTSLARRHGLAGHALFHAQLLANDSFFLAGPAVGAPMAAICLEKLIVLGARRILVYGWCGSLHPTLAAGELFIPTGGISEEGTSGHYQAPAASNGNSLQAALVDAVAVSTPDGSCGFKLAKQGLIWTTDALYRETREKVARYGAQGVMAVDMEYTALRSVAAFRQVDLAAAMLVSDELYHRVWSPRMHLKRFRRQSRHLLEYLCSLIQCGKIA